MLKTVQGIVVDEIVNRRLAGQYVIQVFDGIQNALPV
jgi:hypothetical protein